MIMMVDDEDRRMDIYRLELADVGYQVELYKDVDAALLALEARLADVQLLVLDVMMPPGTAFKATNTLDGLRTGERFFERVRSLSADLSVIFFTNVSDPHLIKRYKRTHHCKLLRKEDYQPYEFAEEVSRIIGPPPSRS
jgi:CheY-like chemotaxis protein